jgi:hypothetical protein
MPSPSGLHMAGEGFGAMAYWNGHVFFAASDDIAYAIMLSRMDNSC